MTANMLTASIALMMAVNASETSVSHLNNRIRLKNNRRKS